jgi:hypothetical protein
LTAVHRTLVDASRTILVWVVDLFVYYVIDENYGEAWQKYSWIQFVGFFLLICGTLVYNSVIKIPFVRYESQEGGSQRTTILQPADERPTKPLLMPIDADET